MLDAGSEAGMTMCAYRKSLTRDSAPSREWQTQTDRTSWGRDSAPAREWQKGAGMTY